MGEDVQIDALVRERLEAEGWRLSEGIDESRRPALIGVRHGDGGGVDWAMFNADGEIVVGIPLTMDEARDFVEELTRTLSE